MSKEPFLDPYRDLIIDTVVKELMGFLLAKIPWLSSFGPAGWLVQKILVSVVVVLLDNTILGLNMVMIRYQILGNAEEVIDLFEQAAALPPENKEQQDAIKEQIIEASRRLIRDNGTRRL